MARWGGDRFNKKDIVVTIFGCITFFNQAKNCLFTGKTLRKTNKKIL